MATNVPKDWTVAVVGLGYVGLPLAVAFGRKFPTVGFDVSESKVAAYRRFVDPTGEVDEAALASRKCSSASTNSCMERYRSLCSGSNAFRQIASKCRSTLCPAMAGRVSLPRSISENSSLIVLPTKGRRPVCNS